MLEKRDEQSQTMSIISSESESNFTVNSTLDIQFNPENDFNLTKEI